jgi:hypothetical protein
MSSHSSQALHSNGSKTSNLITKGSKLHNGPKPFQALTRGTSPGYQPKSAAEKQAAER